MERGERHDLPAPAEREGVRADEERTEALLGDPGRERGGWVWAVFLVFLGASADISVAKLHPG